MTHTHFTKTTGMILLACLILVSPVLASTTVIIYPSIDTTIENWSYNQTWSSIVNAPGNTVDSPAVYLSYLGADTGTNGYRTYMKRINIYDTSVIPASANVTAINYSFVASDGDNSLGVASLVITGGTPASNLALSAADFSRDIDVEYAGRVAFDTINTGGSTRTNISLTNTTFLHKGSGSYSYLYFRNSWEVDNTAPVWGYPKYSEVGIYPVTTANVAHRPFIEVTYDPGPTKTLIIYPDLDTTVEHYANNQTFNNLMRVNAGNTASGSDPYINYLRSDSLTDTYKTNPRRVQLYNTSVIATTSAILKSNISFMCTEGDFGLGVPSLVITSGKLATNASVSTSDYQHYTAPEFTARKAFDTIDYSGTVRTNLTVTNLSLIEKGSGSFTTMYFRNSWDVDNSVTGLTWGFPKYAELGVYGIGDLLARRPYLMVGYDDLPVSSFIVDYTGGISPLQISLTDNSTNIPTTWSWYATDMVGSGGSILLSHNQNPVVALTTGNWSVQFTASNAAGGSNSTATWVNVSAAPALVLPVPAFSANRTDANLTLGATIKFTDLSSSNILGYNWTFETGGNSTESNPEYTYTTTGLKTVILEVVNTSGYNTTTKTNYINITQGPALLVAGFSGTPVSGALPLSVQFNDTSIPTPTSWRWAYKNATGAWTEFSTSQNPSVVFSTLGLYSINLTSTNTFGSDDEIKTDYIYVTSIAVASQGKFIFGTDSNAQNSVMMMWIVILVSLLAAFLIIIGALSGGNLDPQVILWIILGVGAAFVVLYVVALVLGAFGSAVT